MCYDAVFIKHILKYGIIMGLVCKYGKRGIRTLGKPKPT